MAKGKRGPKPSYKPEFHPQDFIDRSGNGETLTEIAQAWRIDRATIYTWEKKYKLMRDAIKKGRESCEAWWIKLGKAGMLNEAKLNGKPVKVNLGFYVWLTKNLFRWSDRVEETVKDTSSNKKVQVVYKAEWGNASEKPGNEVKKK